VFSFSFFFLLKVRIVASYVTEPAPDDIEGIKEFDRAYGAQRLSRPGSMVKPLFSESSAETGTVEDEFTLEMLMPDLRKNSVRHDDDDADAITRGEQPTDMLDAEEKGLNNSRVDMTKSSKFMWYVNVCVCVCVGGGGGYLLCRSLTITIRTTTLTTATTRDNFSPAKVLASAGGNHRP
jgi:hypothetical protein